MSLRGLKFTGLRLQAALVALAMSSIVAGSDDSPKDLGSILKGEDDLSTFNELIRASVPTGDDFELCMRS